MALRGDADLGERLQVLVDQVVGGAVVRHVGMERDLADQELVLYLWQDQWQVQLEGGAVVRREGMERDLADQELELYLWQG